MEYEYEQDIHQVWIEYERVDTYDSDEINWSYSYKYTFDSQEQATQFMQSVRPLIDAFYAYFKTPKERTN